MAEKNSTYNGVREREKKLGHPIPFSKGMSRLDLVEADLREIWFRLGQQQASQKQLAKLRDDVSRLKVEIENLKGTKS